MRRPFVILLVLVGLAVASAVPAGAAGNDRVTRGDVQAHFQAGEGGGNVVFSNTPAAFIAAPANLFMHGIRPFEGSPWDGAHFCEDDWHLLVIALIAADEDQRISHADGAFFLAQSTTELTLDATVLADTERTAMKHFHGGFFVRDGNLVPVQEGWWHQTGAFFAPGELSIGSHSYSAQHDTPFGVFTAGPIEFNIDASGTGACG